MHSSLQIKRHWKTLSDEALEDVKKSEGLLSLVIKMDWARGLKLYYKVKSMELSQVQVKNEYIDGESMVKWGHE